MSRIHQHGPRLQFTTGEVAQICLVSPRTAGKWVDSGRLGGFRIPGSNDRRVPREALATFMSESGMPMTRLTMFDKPPERQMVALSEIEDAA